MLVPTICCGSITSIQICSGNTYLLLLPSVSYGGISSIVVVPVVPDSILLRYGSTTYVTHYSSSQLFVKIYN